MKALGSDATKELVLPAYLYPKYISFHVYSRTIPIFSILKMVHLQKKTRINV
jgi:hypothetical protein